MSHNGFVQGLLENGCHVDILMAADSWGAQDNALPVWDRAVYHCYPSTALQDRLRKKMRGSAVPSAPAAGTETAMQKQRSLSGTVKTAARAATKRLFYLCFPPHPLYPLEHTWLRKAGRFKSDAAYDLVVSNSSPAASHKLAGSLIRNKRITCKRWIQIWEDPWYSDLYGGHSEAVRQEEHALLREASEIYYVSPLTLQYQKQYFPDCAQKMKHVPLPYLETAERTNSALVPGSFGYFGDYYSKTRNLKPFFDALCKSGYSGYIYGDTDLSLSSAEHITVSGRVTLDVLAQVQDQAEVLVHLSNLKGGQIPGKIYHYSATTKPILFILDGTPEEQAQLYTYFRQFDRYYFCENNENSILQALQAVQADIAAGKTWAPVTAFSPRSVVSQL